MSDSTPDRLKEFRAEYDKPRSGRGGALVLAAVAIVSTCAGATVAVVALSQSQPGNAGAGAAPERERALAAYLVSQNQLAPALDAYDRYLNGANASDDERVKVLFSAAKVAIDAEEYEHALRYLYEAEMLGESGDLAGEIDKKILLCLERLGRSVALSRELSSRSGHAREPQGDAPVLAEFGDQRITAHDLERELERLPAAARAGIDTREKKLEFLKNLVAERLLVEKARRLDLHADPEVQEMLARQQDALIVRKLIDDEVEQSLTVTPEDVERFYKAEIDRFTKPEEARGRIADGATEEEALAALESGKNAVVREGAIFGSGYAPDVNEALAAATLAAGAQAESGAPFDAAVQVAERWYAFRGTFTPAQVAPFDQVREEAARAYRAVKEQELSSSASGERAIPRKICSL